MGGVLLFITVVCQLNDFRRKCSSIIFFERCISTYIIADKEEIEKWHQFIAELNFPSFFR